jgi:membrane complex biogenesis BtpA family protein
MGELIDRACRDAEVAQAAGADGVLVENYGDAPFFKDCVPPVTIAAMATIVTHVRQAVTIPVGLNVLRNDARAALSIAAATGGSFIRVNVHCGARVTDQGIIEGRAAETLRLRRDLGANVAILADVAVKHSAPLGPEQLGQSARDTAYRGHADALIVTGNTTGAPVDLDALHAVKQAVPDRPLYLGSGVTEDNVAALLTQADGVIVGTAVKVGGITENPLDPDRTRRLLDRARSANLKSTI